jgi:hypothetical protein
MAGNIGYKKNRELHADFEEVKFSKCQNDTKLVEIKKPFLTADM